MTGERASVVFGETLWRHLFLSHCGKTFWKHSPIPARPVIHPCKDPPFRGAKKTTRGGSPPVTS